MADRHIGLTPPVADSFFEAASVCLDRHHVSPTGLLVNKDGSAINAFVVWKHVDARIRNAWANESDATRDGAYACALAAVELATNMIAIRRAETLTGSDYYIGLAGQSADDLEKLQRLEVSGIDTGNDADIAYRLKMKLNQARAGKSNLPAIACVVGFKAAKIVMQFVEAT